MSSEADLSTSPTPSPSPTGRIAGGAGGDVASTKDRNPALRDIVRVPRWVQTSVSLRQLGQYYLPGLEADRDQGRSLGTGLPLGTCAYLDNCDNVVLVRSQHQEFTTHTHGPKDDRCTHHLAIDDGALWEFEYETEIKIERLHAVSSKTDRMSTGDTLALDVVFEWPCHLTGEVLHFDMRRVPDGTWRKGNDGAGRDGDAKGSNKRRQSEDTVQLLARCDPSWREIYGLRNNTESYFSWLKNRLLKDKRAASLDLDHQVLDLLQVAIVANAAAHYRYLCGLRIPV